MGCSRVTWDHDKKEIIKKVALTVFLQGIDPFYRFRMVDPGGYLSYNTCVEALHYLPQQALSKKYIEKPWTFITEHLSGCTTS